MSVESLRSRTEQRILGGDRRHNLSAFRILVALLGTGAIATHPPIYSSTQAPGCLPLPQKRPEFRPLLIGLRFNKTADMRTRDMDLAQLNQAYGLDGQISFGAGKGGFPDIEVTNDQATALISLYGGQVLSFQPCGVAADLLFVSETAYYQTGKAIKGGVPVCWPWFGPDPEGKGRPSHGFVRNRLWQVQSTQGLPGGATQVVLGLSDTDETRELWPHAFELALEITVGRTLQLMLSSRNVGDRPFDITQALHTYFTVGDIAQTTVQGLDGTTYIDKVDGQKVKPQSGPIAIAGEVDRIYQGVPSELMIVDGASDRRIRITSTGNQTAVVWNPWVEISKQSGDLTDDAYQQFVCVETTNAADDVVTVAPQSEYRLAVTYDILMADPLT